MSFLLRKSRCSLSVQARLPSLQALTNVCPPGARWPVLPTPYLPSYHLPSAALVQPPSGGGGPQDRPKTIVLRISAGDSTDPIDAQAIAVDRKRAADIPGTRRRSSQRSRPHRSECAVRPERRDTLSNTSYLTLRKTL
jgi:hypothetical protein